MYLFAYGRIFFRKKYEKTEDSEAANGGILQINCSAPDQEA